MTPDPIAAATHLADTLARENAALEALDLAGAVALVPEKRAALAAVAALGEWTLSPLRRQAMAMTVDRLRVLAAENKQLLRRAMTVQGRVIEVITGVLPCAEPTGRYAASGVRAQPVRAMAWSLVTRV